MYKLILVILWNLRNLCYLLLLFFYCVLFVILAILLFLLLLLVFSFLSMKVFLNIWRCFLLLKFYLVSLLFQKKIILFSYECFYVDVFLFNTLSSYLLSFGRSNACYLFNIIYYHSFNRVHSYFFTQEKTPLLLECSECFSDYWYLYSFYLLCLSSYFWKTILWWGE